MEVIEGLKGGRGFRGGFGGGDSKNHTFLIILFIIYWVWFKTRSK